ncbi:unnamed protein product, partial [Hymenolepis diminuta]
RHEGILIHQINGKNKAELIPYIEDTVLSIANLICAKYECQAKILKSVFPGKGISVIPHSLNQELEDEEGANTEKYENDPKVREPWKDPEENLLDNPISHLRQWSPLLGFRFSNPNIDCEKLKYMFDVTAIKEEGRQGPLREWIRNSELSTFSEFLSIYHWRKQDRPHSMYYAP